MSGDFLLKNIKNFLICLLKYTKISVLLIFREGYMKKKELFDFVRDFNKIKTIPQSTIMEGLRYLPQEDHKLFMAIVNLKNGDKFRELIDKDGN